MMQANKCTKKKKRETICNRRPHQPWILTYMSRTHIAFNIRIHRLSRHSKSVFGNKNFSSHCHWNRKTKKVVPKSYHSARPKCMPFGDIESIKLDTAGCFQSNYANLLTNLLFGQTNPLNILHGFKTNRAYKKETWYLSIICPYGGNYKFASRRAHSFFSVQCNKSPHCLHRRSSFLNMHGSNCNVCAVLLHWIVGIYYVQCARYDMRYMKMKWIICTYFVHYIFYIKYGL